MDWYLMKNNYSSGFENDLISMAQSQYNEMTEAIGKIVVLYDSDLNEETKKDIKGQIKGNHPNTKLKSMERIITFPIGTCKAGQYIYYKDNYWLITGFVDDDSICESALLLMCNYDLRWQDDNGVIKHRFANIVSNAQYNTGITENNEYSLQSDQLLITLPSDEDTLSIDEPMRFFIGYGKKKKVYKVTRPDTVPYFYGNTSGLVQIVVKQDRVNLNTDDCENGICDYVKPSENQENYSILGSSELYVKGGEFTYSFSHDGNTIDNTFVTWSIDVDYVNMKISDDNSVILSVDDFKKIGKIFNLCAEYSGNKVVLPISVKGFY